MAKVPLRASIWTLDLDSGFCILVRDGKGASPGVDLDFGLGFWILVSSVDLAISSAHASQGVDLDFGLGFWILHSSTV